MRRVREVIIVEGRYDKNTVSQAVSATILETSGFGIFSDKEKIALLREIVNKRGVVIFTDGDRAGFFIRGRLGGMLGKGVKHAYIPDIKGRERRKSVSSKEGKLGVEGMAADIIIAALERAGATFENEPEHNTNPELITKSDFYDLGLSGKPDSGEKRRLLSKKLKLPARLSSNGLLDVVNVLYTRDDFINIVSTI